MKNVFLTIGLFLWAIVFSGFYVPGADQNSGLEKEKRILLEMDQKISTVSSKHGILKAFFPFLTAKSVLFPAKGHPLVGKKACVKLIDQVDMSGQEGKLKWEPMFADVSSAGDLGYTHGRFERPIIDPKGNKKNIPGYYGTIWEKDANGKWNVVVSQGLIFLRNLNQGPINNRIEPAKMDSKAKEVVSRERAFSKYSVENGIPEAFYSFIADNGIALSSSGPPRTKETFARAIAAAKKKKETGKPVPKTKLEWEPFFSHVSASGDMAYNYGPYKYTVATTDSNGKIKEQAFYGYFVTVWKKQADGKWKFVFDGGNQSPGPEEKKEVEKVRR
jgi:ketosteroid isomerase-like protein